VVALFNVQDLIFELGVVFIVLFLVGFSLAGQTTCGQSRKRRNTGGQPSLELTRRH
jgi:hypothetical protein